MQENTESKILVTQTDGDQKKKTNRWKLDDYEGNGYCMGAGMVIGAFTGVAMVRITDEYSDVVPEILMGLLGGTFGGLIGFSPHILIFCSVVGGSTAASIFIARKLWPRKWLNS